MWSNSGNVADRDILIQLLGNSHSFILLCLTFIVNTLWNLLSQMPELPETSILTKSQADIPEMTSMMETFNRKGSLTQPPSSLTASRQNMLNSSSNSTSSVSKSSQVSETYSSTSCLNLRHFLHENITFTSSSLLITFKSHTSARVSFVTTWRERRAWINTNIRKKTTREFVNAQV